SVRSRAAFALPMLERPDRRAALPPPAPRAHQATSRAAALPLLDGGMGGGAGIGGVLPRFLIIDPVHAELPGPVNESTRFLDEFGNGAHPGKLFAFRVFVAALWSRHQLPSPFSVVMFVITMLGAPRA